MKAIVDAKEFSQALNRVIKVIKKSTIPALEGVLVQVKDGRCTLIATDFTTWLSVTIPAAGDDLGFVFQHPKDAARACAHFEGQLVLITEGRDNGKARWTQLTMSSGARTAEVRAFLEEDYPTIPEHQARHTYTVNAARLLERVDHVKYTLVKPNIGEKAQRSHVQFGGNKVFALDGHRLAWDVDDSLVVRQPFMALPEALGYLKFFGDQEVTASMGERYLQLTDGTTTILTRIEGPFVFNVDNAVPKSFLEEFYISPKDFLRELDYLKGLMLSTDKTHVYFSGGKLSITAASGNYSTEVAISGENTIYFGFDLRYMIDALRQFQGEKQIKLKVNSPVAPIVLEAEGRGDFALVLPVQIKASAKVA